MFLIIKISLKGHICNTKGEYAYTIDRKLSKSGVLKGGGVNFKGVVHFIPDLFTLSNKNACIQTSKIMKDNSRGGGGGLYKTNCRDMTGVNRAT